MKTTQDLICYYTGYGKFSLLSVQDNHGIQFPIIVPKGTRTTHKTSCGIDENYNFIDDFSFLKDHPYRALIMHDITHRGINVPKEFLEEDN